MQVAILPQRNHPAPGPVYLTVAPAPEPATMSSLVEVPVNADLPATLRRTLLAQPLDYFRPYFDGRAPTDSERLGYIEKAVQLMTPARLFLNNLYRVSVFESAAAGTSFFHLAIERLDGQPNKDWRHFQQIKNELVGPEHEAMEIFPAESRLVDAGHQYHLWVHRDPAFRFPVGWWLRVVREQQIPLVYDDPATPPRQLSADSCAAA